MVGFDVPRHVWWQQLVIGKGCPARVAEDVGGGCVALASMARVDTDMTKRG
jgi:hypothetical protein